MTTRNETATTREAPLQRPSYLDAKNARNLTAKLNVLLAGVFAIYIKTKTFHWHVTGPISVTTTCCLMSKPSSYSQ
jgi:starvation-inducible DNA-binding protein